MKKKSILLILMAVISAFSLVSCSENDSSANSSETDVSSDISITTESEVSNDFDKESEVTTENATESTEPVSEVASFDNAKDLMEYLMEQKQNNQFEYAEIWDNYISDTTKKSGIITKEEYVANGQEADFKSNTTLTDYMIKEPVKLKETVYSVESVAKYDSGKSENIKTYAINENGVYKLLLDGVISTTKFLDSSSSKLTLTNVEEYECVEGVVLKYSLVNNSSMDIQQGWAGASSADIVTDSGKSSSSFTDRPKTLSGNTNDQTCSFANVFGTIKTFTLNNIIELSDSGLPSSLDVSGRSYTFTFTTTSK